jgi:triosephosphate isomerase
MPHRRVPLVAGNWKMNPPSVAEAVSLARSVSESTAGLHGADLAVAPPYVFLVPVRDALAGSPIRLAAQDLHEQQSGAHTGGISARMLRELVDLVIVGHSEVRRDRGDTDERVNAKLRRALAAGLTPILCVGEVLEVRRAGGADEFVRAQVRAAFDRVSVAEAARATLAYEPIWAIGTGLPATGEDARATVAAARAEVRAIFGEATAEAVRILYGGSVTAETIGEFASQPGIDGALVGGASLEADGFAQIARVVAESRS